ncbi:hypothetical protein D3C71_1309400 [compost metagenome]
MDGNLADALLGLQGLLFAFLVDVENPGALDLLDVLAAQLGGFAHPAACHRHDAGNPEHIRLLLSRKEVLKNRRNIGIVKRDAGVLGAALLHVPQNFCRILVDVVVERSPGEQ